jgi:hypothetical protein
VRAYLAAVLTHGLQGRIVAEGQSYNSVMPSQAQLADEAWPPCSTMWCASSRASAVPAFEPAELARHAPPASPKALRAQRDAALAPWPAPRPPRRAARLLGLCLSALLAWLAAGPLRAAQPLGRQPGAQLPADLHGLPPEDGSGMPQRGIRP